MNTFKANVVRLLMKVINLFLVCGKNVLWWRKPDSALKNICIYRLGNVGDIICAIPAMYKIRGQYPNARITLLTSPGNRNAIGAENILQGVTWLDEIDTYYSDDIATMNKFIIFLQKQRNKKYDYLIQLPAERSLLRTQVRNMLFFKAIGVKYADGFYVSTIDLFRRAQLNKINSPNEVERLVEGLPFKNDVPIQFPVRIQETDKIYIENILRECGLDDSDKIMLISHAGKAKRNLWPYANFREVSARWENNGGVVIVLGGRGEFEQGQMIINDLKTKAYNFCGKTTLPQSMYLLTKAKFLLTIDTGTAHLASAMDVDCITLSSSALFKNKWTAYGKKNKVFRKDLECSPCMRQECKYSDNRCMRAISVNEVWECIEKNFL